MSRDTIAVLDFGSQYTQVIARRVRESKVYCELFPWNASPESVLSLEPRGIILLGGPSSVYAPDAPQLPDYVLERGVPRLGICYGMQLLAHHLGSHVTCATKQEYGPARVELVGSANPLLSNLPSAVSGLHAWMSHGDRIEDLPDGFAVLVRSANAPVAAMGNLERDIYALQFHPEVVHTDHGHEILRRFAVDVCGCTPDWAPASFIGQAVETIRDQVGDGHVVCGLGRGVDSSVTATLLHRALGEQRTASSSTLGYCARVSRNRSQALSEIGLACGS